MRLSLRARVALATALGAAIIVVTLGFLVSQAIERNNLTQIDQRLEAGARLVSLNSDFAVPVLVRFGDTSQFALTVRDGDAVRSSTPTVVPPQTEGVRTLQLNGAPYRVYTIAPKFAPGRTISLALPAKEAEDMTAKQRRQVVGAGALAVAAAGGLGWLLGGRAVRPIVELTRRVNAGQSIPKASGVREAEELATAIARAQGETAAALAAARDFAAASAHELRTPLTAMRTDIEVLSTLELDDAQRTEILDDLQRAQNRVEATLSALERLASGELASADNYVDTDVVELCDLSAQDTMRHHPGLSVRVDSDQSLVVRGLPAGLRLAVDNALTNAVKHGNATEAVISAHLRDGKIVIAVDDNGTGVAPAERELVFERFYRGPTATKGGSGLGLALVAQQAALHGGRAYFADSALGGARLVLELLPETP